MNVSRMEEAADGAAKLNEIVHRNLCGGGGGGGRAAAAAAKRRANSPSFLVDVRPVVTE